MAMTDPIADFLTIIRNGLMVKKTSVSIPANKMKAEMARVLKESGYIRGFSVTDGKKPVMEVVLKYGVDGKSAIREIKRVSKPGCRAYADSKNIPIEKNGIGIFIISTTKGLLTDQAARRAGVGGEVVCSIS